MSDVCRGQWREREQCMVSVWQQGFQQNQMCLFFATSLFTFSPPSLIFLGRQSLTHILLLLIMHPCATVSHLPPPNRPFLVFEKTLAAGTVLGSWNSLNGALTNGAYHLGTGLPPFHLEAGFSIDSTDVEKDFPFS